MTYYEIELPILYKPDNLIALEGLDVNVEFKLSEHDVRMATFYTISGIAPHYDPNDNDKEYCSIFSGGNEFLSNMTYKELQSKLRLLNYEKK